MTRVRVQFVSGQELEFETTDYEGMLGEISANFPSLHQETKGMYFDGSGAAFRVDQVLSIERQTAGDVAATGAKNGKEEG